jgi:hypothetical protein
MRLRSCTEGNQNENEVKQKRVCEAATKLMTLLALSLSKGRTHSRFVFVASEVEKSNVYKDLYTLKAIDFKKLDDKNK